MATHPWSDSVEARLRGLDRSRAPFLRAVLVKLAELGCRAEIPPAERTDYINIAPPPGHGRGRICSIHVRTARVEFQNNSHALAESLGVAPRFNHLAAGDKASIALRGDADVMAALRLAEATLASRRGT